MKQQHLKPGKPERRVTSDARAHRIGQQKEVVVYYPTAIANEFVTFEKKLDESSKKKRGLAKDMLTGAGYNSIHN